MKLPSVTQVLSPFTDFSKIDPEVLAAACQRGTELHGLIANTLLGLWVPDIPENCKGYFESFQSWALNIEKVVTVEERMTCKTYQFTGMPDALLYIRGDGGLSLVDWKSPATVSPSWRLQCAAYKHLAQVHDYPVERVFALRLDKSGKRARMTEYTGTAHADFSVFLACLTAFKFFHTGD